MWIAHKRSELGKAALACLLVAVLFVLGMTVAYGATGTFNITVPAFGSQTGNQCRTTTANNGRRIDIKYSANPQDSQIKAVRCSDGTNVGGFTFVNAGDHTKKTIHTNVIVGTMFKLNIDTPGCCSSATFTGQVFF